MFSREKQTQREYFLTNRLLKTLARICLTFFIVLLYALFPLRPISSAWAEASCDPASTSSYRGVTLNFSGNSIPGYWSSPGGWPPTGISRSHETTYFTTGSRTVTFTDRDGKTADCSVSLQAGGTCSPSPAYAAVGATINFSSSDGNFTRTYNSPGTYIERKAADTTAACLVHVGTHSTGCTINAVCDYPTENCVNCSVDCGACVTASLATYSVRIYSTGNVNYNASATAAGNQPGLPAGFQMNTTTSNHYVTTTYSGPRPKVAFCVQYGGNAAGNTDGDRCWENWSPGWFPRIVLPSGGCTATECRHDFTLTNPTTNTTSMTVKVAWMDSNICTSPSFAGPWSNANLTTSSPISLRNITELRARIDELRVDAGLTAFSWTDTPLLVDTPTRAIHINELRAALLEVYTTCRDAGLFSGTIPPFLSTQVTAGVSLVSLTHIKELREAAEDAP